MMVWHGSPVANLVRIDPKRDLRTGITAVWATPYFKKACLFALLPSRWDCKIDYQTHRGKFASGVCHYSQKPNLHGFVYLVEKDFLQKRKEDYLAYEPLWPVACLKVELSMVNQWWSFLPRLICQKG